MERNHSVLLHQLGPQGYMPTVLGIYGPYSSEEAERITATVNGAHFSARNGDLIQAQRLPVHGPEELSSDLGTFVPRRNGPRDAALDRVIEALRGPS